MAGHRRVPFLFLSVCYQVFQPEMIRWMVPRYRQFDRQSLNICVLRSM
ncbi:hypothetical protein BSU04_41730 [Caballeronia sordidicola]|uniref:Uncharacterized protein n=1 Tax=Caballeronia sordidicola TaxID=196367 RepID=A0A226WNQ7_CABSO|nr:hypothetical protein BSU04_41730 [Caballeronia sordidicola]